MSKNEPESASPSLTAALERIRAALKGLRYGTVTIVVQDGVIVQVERSEKFRIQQPR